MSCRCDLSVHHLAARNYEQSVNASVAASETGTAAKKTASYQKNFRSSVRTNTQWVATLSVYMVKLCRIHLYLLRSLLNAARVRKKPAMARTILAPSMAVMARAMQPEYLVRAAWVSVGWGPKICPSSASASALLRHWVARLVASHLLLSLRVYVGLMRALNRSRDDQEQADDGRVTGAIGIPQGLSAQPDTVCLKSKTSATEGEQIEVGFVRPPHQTKRCDQVRIGRVDGFF